MVPEQVLRIVGFLAALGAAAAPVRAQDDPAPTLGVIDLARGSDTERTTRRQTLVDELAGISGFELTQDASVAAALAGQAHDPNWQRGSASLEQAAAAYAVPNCTAAQSHAEAAIVDLSAAQASGGQVTSMLERAYVFALLCAHQAGDSAAAARYADRLRALGVVKPSAIPDPVWSRYPALDAAAGQRIVELAITTVPTGTPVWVDHKVVGTSPVQVFVGEGEHLIAAAHAGGSAAEVIEVAGKSSAQLNLPKQTGSTAKLQSRVRAMRSGASRLSERTVGAILQAAGLDYAVVIGPRGTLTVWSAGKARGTARQLGVATTALDVGAYVAEVELAGKGPGIDPNQPLLRETDVNRDAGKSKGPSRQEWWVYAAIAGAVLVGAGIVLANDVGDDMQRIEISF